MLFNSDQIKTHGEHAAGRWVGGSLCIDFDDHSWPIYYMEFPSIDMAQSEGLELDIENTGGCMAVVFGYAGEEDLYCWSSGLLELEPGERGKLKIFVFQDKPLDVAAAYPHMMGAPGRSAHMYMPDEPRPAKLCKLRIELEGQGRPVQITVHGALTYGLRNPPTGKAAKSLYPIMDRYGQYRHNEWNNKIRQSRDLHQRDLDECRNMGNNAPMPDRSSFGGWTGGLRHESTGHFYTLKIDGRWSLVDPDGYPYWAYGPSYVQPSCKAAQDGYEHLFEELVPDGDFYKANLIRKYGTDWMESFFNRAHARIRHWGMNTFGIASDRELCLTSRTPYSMGIRSIRFGAKYGLGELDGAWKKRLDEDTAAVCEKTAGDPYCIGYFIDNEIHDKPDFGRWDYYYATCRETLKKYAPNKLYLGSRQDWHRYPRGGVPMRIDNSDGLDNYDYSTEQNGYETVLRAYAAHADVLAFNQYRYSYFNLRMPDYADKPILISETTVGALDRGMLHPSLRPVNSQEERAFAFRHMLNSALENPWIVGVHWFMYMDQVCTGWAHNGENFQMGLVDICDTPYPELVESVKTIGRNMYKLRFLVY